MREEILKQLIDDAEKCIKNDEEIQRLYYDGHTLVYTIGKQNARWECTSCSHEWEGYEGWQCPECGTMKNAPNWKCDGCDAEWVGAEKDNCPSCGKSK